MRQPTYFNFSILPFLFFLLFSLCLATSNSNNHSEHFVQCLLQNSDNSTAMSQIIYTTKNPLYTEILDRLAQNLRFRTPETPKPVAVLTPSHESQIKTAIYCSKKVGLQMRIRSGGNDMEGSSYVSYVPFFVLDTYGFRSIDVDNAAKTAWVGTGATYGEFYYALNQSDTSLAFPGPYWPTVGVGGHICSGGFGGLIRKHGVAADNVVDARIINAEGEILDRESMGEDLFWALRGGSCASFGVVIAFKLKLVSVPKSFPAFNVKRTLDENALSLIYKWQHIAPSLPKEITLTTQVYSFLPNNSTKQNIIANFVAIFLGDMDGLISLLDKHFPEIGVTKNDISMVDWATSNIFHLSFPIENSAQILRNRTPPDAVPYLKMVSDFFQHPIPKKGIKKMLDIMMEAKAGEAFLEMTPLKGIMEEIPESSIPFPHRNNLFLIGEKIGWFEPDHAEERLAWSRKFRKFLGKYVADNPRGAFVNYRNDELGVNNVDGSTSFEQAKSWGIPYYKGNFERLARIKTEVDPENYFKYEQSIPILPVHSKL